MILLGDVNGDGVVNAQDVAQAKTQKGQPVTQDNYRDDVNNNGVIDAADVTFIRNHE